MRMAKALVVATAVALLAAVSSGGSSSGDQVWVLPDTASNRQHATYLQMLGLAAVEDAARIRVYAEHLEEAADYLRLMGVSWEVCIEDVSQYLQNVTSRRRRRDSLPYPSPRFPCTLDYCPEPLVHRWMSYEEVRRRCAGLSELKGNYVFFKRYTSGSILRYVYID
ncbi:uncharacterized protein [Penaeus vannamei]|uniref:uncharacterized protein isoform X2 n=1 Tax=Penaeus vannamei TaxID=6689 RepID=UPI00387F415F